MRLVITREAMVDR